MLPSTVLHDFDALPPIAQEQVIDFIAFVKSRYQVKPKKSFIDILTSIPNVGQDDDFSREQDESNHDVFT